MDAARSERTHTIALRTHANASHRITSRRIASELARVARALETDPRNVHPHRRWNASPPVRRGGFFPFLAPLLLSRRTYIPTRFPHPLATLPSTRETRNALVRQRELPLTSLAA